jgi:type I restriction enzyme M protein
MLTKDIRKTIDNARDVLVGKIPNPQSQIEQITIAMIYKFMDDMDIESVEFGGERQFFVEELSEYAWSKIMSQQLGNEARMNLYTEALDKLQLSDRIPKLFRDIFKGAYLPFRDGQTLTLFLKEINDLSYSNSENLGNGFEYLLSIMGSQGDAGQFRTPRHIIDFIVDIVKPTKADTILDPACGTAGFLISAYKFIQKCVQDSNQPLNPQERTALTENIQGYDISPDMVKLALVNMYLHKFKNPKIYEYDTLTQDTRWENYFDCILANPPFMTPKGGIQPHNKFGVKANRSEVLFVDYIMEHLNSTGRAGVIVPEGIVFQSANAYKELRKKLVDEKYLYAVVSLPSGIFQPYSGVKTSILFMDRQLAKKTDKVLFVEIQNDGFDLGAQRRPIDKNDLPKALKLINQWQNVINTQTDFSADSKIITLVEKSKLAENGEYNLTASRYKKTQDFSNCKWDMVRLGDVCELKRGTAITKKEIIDGDIPVIAGGQNPAYYHNEHNRIGETITVAGSGAYAGFISYYNTPIFVSDAFTIRSLDEKICTNKYVYNILKAKQDYIYSLQSGMGVPHIYVKDLIDYEIPLPPLEVQEEIVKELDGYQAVIDGAQKVIDNWKPTLPINSEWEKVKLGDVCELTYGYTDTALEAGNTRFIRITDIDIFGQIKDYDCKYINSNNETDKYLLHNNDIIVARTGATYGKTALFKGDYKAVYASFLIKLDFDKTKVYNPYYWAFAQSQDYINQAAKLVSGVAQPQFNANAIKSIEFYIPSIEKQKEIVSKIQDEEKAIEECKKLIKLHQEKINTKIQSIWGDSCE